MPSRTNDLSPQEKRELLKRILEESGVSSNRQILDQSRQYATLEDSPEYKEVSERIRMLADIGIDNAYFGVTEGINNGTITIDGRELTNFCSYNYLGMSGDPIVSRAAKEAIDQYGTSGSASRIASGEKPLHGQLEKELSSLLDTEDCMVMVGGFVTNESIIGRLVGQDDLVLYDSLAHISIMEGSRLSGARVRPFPHNRWEALDRMLEEERQYFSKALILIEGVYSMDGDIPDLPRFIEVKKKHAVQLMIDEAHSIGVLGNHGAGIGEHFNVDRSDVDIWMGTLSKSFASCGGYVAGRNTTIEYLKFTTPGFVYSVASTPPDTAAALASVRMLKAQPERCERLRYLASLFLDLAQARGLNTGTSHGSAVVPIIVGQSQGCFALYKYLYEHGVYSSPVVHPAVAEDAARLRFFISCTHTEEQIRATVQLIADGVDAQSLQ